jgi:hypothetical protein
VNFAADIDIFYADSEDVASYNGATFSGNFTDAYKLDMVFAGGVETSSPTFDCPSRFVEDITTGSQIIINDVVYYVTATDKGFKGITVLTLSTDQ